MEIFSFSSWQELFKIAKTGLGDPGSLHPLVIHFPFGFILLAPFFLIFVLFFQRHAKILLMNALLLLMLGTLSIFFSVETGEKAVRLISVSPDLIKTLKIHSQLADQSLTIFGVLTISLFLYTVFYSFLIKRFPLFLHRILLIVFLFFYISGLGILLRAGHYGAKAVHQHGAHSPLFVE